MTDPVHHPAHASDPQAVCHDPVNHPGHYCSHASGVECITIVEEMNFNVGCAIKYLWRAGLKSPDPTLDLQKAAWHVDRELKRLKARKENPRAT